MTPDDAREHEMNNPPPRSMDRDTAERLLDGDPVALSRAGRLAVPLRAARGPIRPDELAGEQAALAAFVAAADLTRRPAPRREPMLKIFLTKLLTAKAASVIAATGLGGVALAGGTGVLPNPLVDPATPPATHAPAAPGSDRPQPTTATGPTGAAGSPASSLAGLCEAYAAGAADNPGKALENPAFTELVEAAGGADKVQDYCADALSDESRRRPSIAPPATGRPSDRPTPAPGGGAPTSRPDTPATKRPSGVPNGTVPAPPSGNVPAATPSTPGR
ncbi:hypothetical protein Jiend_17740 [Micromonospora endophytica]|nr:hypothetical protein D3H59_01785 [Micromonospora endophytica]BCJ58352.1 hypothetical protein Jiend_17740 [Micromonospora endophytica]